MATTTKADNLRFWSSVEKSDPAYVKKVDQRGGYKSVTAYSQLKAATEAWGPIGDKWWYEEVRVEIVEGMYMLTIDIFSPLGEHPVRIYVAYAMFPPAAKRPDELAPLKALTKAICKGITYWGFNADIFMGRFDQSAYVTQRKAEVQGSKLPRITGDQIIRIVDLAKEAYGASGGEDHVSMVLQARGMDSIEQVSLLQAKDWINRLEKEASKDA